MKTLCKNIKNSLLALTLLSLALPSFAADLSTLISSTAKRKKTEASGLVLSAKGEAFVVSENRTVPLETSDYIYDFSEIVTSDNAQVTFKDKFDHKYHLAPGSHIKILNRIIELKTGYLWIKSEGAEKGFTVQTANAKVAYNQGEGIVTYDALSGKTQLLVVQGEMDFSNILLDENKVTVTDATFSFLTGDMENTTPRAPTSVGQASFSKMVSIFLGAKPDHEVVAHAPVEGKHETKSEVKEETHAVLQVTAHQVEKTVHEVKPERSVASVEEKKGTGKFIYVVKKKDEEELAKKDKQLEELYQNNLAVLEKNKPKKVKPAWTPDYTKKSEVAVKIYGVKKTAAPSRLPASTIEYTSPAPVSSTFDDMARDMKQQNEADDLIRQLNNFRSE